ncbi:unnamed protein product [Diatraea saccharalis]|uniref:FHA domain-containing protein n=1 Tax=Diatraea saccharalis TaxID=40085 RepID=A0A9N9QYM5_9NEOP|nr:unnamed protein product [Diatraea saccharalis]
MWYLANEKNGRVIYVTEEITVGRNADQQECFVIADDPSISRKHATLYNVNNELFLQDLGSRYGTFVNNSSDKVESKLMKQLNEGDHIKFGKMSSVFKVHFKSLVTCTSTLKGENLQNLRECLSSLSGTLKSEWDESCKYLTMPAITLTMKVVLALVQGAHIVTVEFWNKCLDAVKSQVMLPDPHDYTPQIIESTLNKENVTFLPNSRRQTLFSDKTVVFFSKRQYEMYKTVLSNAAANPLLLSECALKKITLCEKNFIVIQYNITAASQETETQKHLIQEIVDYLKSKGKRLITDVEIGLAVLYCSTQKYCNPDFQFPTEIIKQSDQNIKQSKVLAQETQEQNQNIQSNRENVVINESLSSTNNIENEKCKSQKRKACDENDIQENSLKKIAISISSHVEAYIGTKRKNEDEHEIETNPTKKLAVSSESGDSQAFNFVTKSSTHNTEQHEESTKRLNLIKPHKRKLESDDNEDSLFQFVQNKPKMPYHNKSNIFDSKKEIDSVEIERKSEIISNKTKCTTYKNEDLASLRGAKLEELMKNNEKLLKNEDIDISKKFIKEELDERMSELNLGTTIVTVKKELIVKKEPVFVEEQNTKVKNFKKFKKVWPIKMQISLISMPANSSNEKHLSSMNREQNYVNETAD